MTDTQLPLEIDPIQGRLYNKLKHRASVELTLPASDAAEVPAAERTIVIPNALSRLLKMEQVLSHPWTFLPGVEGAKMEWLMEWSTGYTHQALIVTRFKETARHIAAWLKDHADERFESGCRSAITGDLSVGARDSIIKSWKDGKQQFVVGTIDTLGIGLSFPEAHHMVAFDIVPSVIKMDQVRHRIHRLTTDHPVEIIYPLVEGTTNVITFNAVFDRWQQLELVRAFIEHVHEAG
jgi:superfamily II DNA/RNA helicase